MLITNEKLTRVYRQKCPLPVHKVWAVLVEPFYCDCVETCVEMWIDRLVEREYMSTVVCSLEENLRRSFNNKSFYCLPAEVSKNSTDAF